MKRPRFEIQYVQYGSRLEGYQVFDNETEKPINLPKIIESRSDLQQLTDLLNGLQDRIDQLESAN